MVEFAIAVPVLLLLMLGIIDFGVNFGNKVETTHAAREGARAGSVNRVGTDDTCPMNPSGALAVDTRRLICLTKARTHMDPTAVAVKVMYMGRNGKLTTDFSPGTTAANPYSLVVCVSAKAYSLTGMLSGVLDGRFHHIRSVVKTGKPASGAFVPPGQERPLRSGAVTDSWAWCSADDPVGSE
jgi:hypothetical protein